MPRKPRDEEAQPRRRLPWFGLLMAPIELNGTPVNSLQLGKSPKLVPRLPLVFPPSPLNQEFVSYEFNLEYAPPAVNFLAQSTGKTGAHVSPKTDF